VTKGRAKFNLGPKQRAEHLAQVGHCALGGLGCGGLGGLVTNDMDLVKLRQGTL
jgi:hypothetical protein